MSADNYLLIDRETFKVYMGFASQDYKSVDQMHLEGEGKSLDEAIDIANKLLRDEVIEYGIHFSYAP